MLVKQRNNTEYSAWYFDLGDTTFYACQHGSSFAKTTRLKGTPGLFDHLAGCCSEDHEHPKWLVLKHNSSWVFNAATEAEYPKLLATIWSTHSNFCVSLQLRGDNYKGPTAETKYKIGFYFSPAEHFDKAIQLKHSALEFNVVPDVLRVNFFRLCTLGPHAMARTRISALKDVMRLKLETAEQEKRMRESMEKPCESSDKGKALVIVEEAFSGYGCLQIHGRRSALDRS